jgi:MoxR-like ATPase
MPKVSYTTEQQNELLKNLSEFYNKTLVTPTEIMDYVKSSKLSTPYFLFRDKSRKVGRGQYSVEMTGTVTPLKPLAPLPRMKAVSKPVETSAPQMVTDAKYSSVAVMRSDISCTIPERDPTYVPFGNYADIETIIKSKKFFPVYITGLSGNGKTMSIMQACAKLKRQLLRINVTEETDELDLLGGTELVNGNTVYREGAVILAMREGAVLLIDEGDLNNTKILCLMPILEGKPYLNKKTGEIIHPKEGFNVFITGNTKGQGSEDGRYIGTKIMNEAFLERFAITMEQEYPSLNVEKKIVLKNMEQNDCVDDDFALRLVEWASTIRKGYDEGIQNEIISTRRLTHIIKAFALFGDRLKAVTLALNRFDRETKQVFVDLYTKHDASVNPQPEAPVEEKHVAVVNTMYGHQVITTTDPATNDVTVEWNGQRAVITSTEIVNSHLSKDEIVKSMVESWARQFGTV